MEARDKKAREKGIEQTFPPTSRRTEAKDEREKEESSKSRIEVKKERGTEPH
jgi:hypothetical protein